MSEHAEVLTAQRKGSFDVEGPADVRLETSNHTGNPAGQVSSFRPSLQGSFKPSEHGSFVHRHATGSAIVESFIGGEGDTGADADRYRRICGCWWSGNTRVLFATAVLFTIITTAQYFAARIAKSEALLADCVSMAVDALTYFMNIGVEMLKGTKAHRPAQMIVPLISISLLSYFTIGVILEATPNLHNYDGADDVNPWIVFAFACWGIVFDVASIYFFWRNAKKMGANLGINMMAAFLHVGADFARSCTTFVESILIIGFGFNGTVTDAWACMMVSAIILAGAAFALFEWFLDALKGCKAEVPTTVVV